MPNNIASSYTNSIDPAGGISRPTTTRGTHPEPLSPSADLNARLPVTAEQLKAQQVPTMPSEQVAKTNLGQSQGPVFIGPYGQAVRAGVHRDGMTNDGAKAIEHTNALNMKGRIQQNAKGKAVVSPQTLDKLNGINARAALKGQLVERFKEARAEERLSPGRKLGRSL